MRAVLLATLLLFSRAAFAESVKVLFFGGTGSTQKEMEDWTTRASAKCQATHEFEAVRSPIGNDMNIGDNLSGSGSPAKKKLLDAVVEKYVREIVANPEREYVIAGHSSAGSLAKVVAYNVMLCQTRKPKCLVKPIPPDYTDKYKDKIKLKLLDGGQTGKADFKAVKDYFTTECWAEEEGLNVTGLKAGCGVDRFHTVKAKECASSNCRHYAIVNLTPPPQVEGYAGYKGGAVAAQWEPNLKWVGGGCGEPKAAPRNQLEKRHEGVQR